MKRKRCKYCKGDKANERRLFPMKYLGKNGLHTLIEHPEKIKSEKITTNGTPYTDDQWKAWYTHHKSSDEINI